MNNMHSNNYNGQNFADATPASMPEIPRGSFGAAPAVNPPVYAGFGQNAGFIATGTAGNVCPVNCDDVMNVTTVTDLHRYASGQVVRFPDFSEGQPFVARVRRPSMLVLAKSGKIPNALLNSANELFAKGGGGMDPDNPNMLSDIYEVCKVIAEAALIQPTWAEIEAAGVQLSDDQMMAIFSYTQTGIKALESFRKE